MKKHYVLTCVSFFLFGVGMSVQQMGIKAGLGLWPTIIIFVSCMIFFGIVLFTSNEKVKNALFKKDDQ